MNQFTSHLDFSLTRKRFLMMGRKASFRRVFFKRLVLIPLLGVIFVPFCFTSDSYKTHSNNGRLQFGQPIKVEVYASNVQLIEGVDYEVNYSLGSVKILNELYLNPAQKIEIKYL